MHQDLHIIQKNDSVNQWKTCRKMFQNELCLKRFWKNTVLWVNSMHKLLFYFAEKSV